MIKTPTQQCKSLDSTIVYIGIEKAIYGQLRDEDFTVRVANTLEEDQELIKAGFEYVTERRSQNLPEAKVNAYLPKM